MCVSSYKASSRDHCCPRRSDMAAQSLRSLGFYRTLCETQVGYFLVEGLEVRQVRCLAQGQGIAKHGLDAGEPPR